MKVNTFVPQQPLTPKQKKALDFINRFTTENDYAPSLQEIANYFKKSISSAQHFVEELHLKGYLQKRTSSARSITTIGERKGHVFKLGYIAAGKPIEPIENPEPIEVPPSLLKTTGDHYALEVKGLSMIEDNILDGDTIIIRHQRTAEDGDRVVAITEEGATLKIFRKRNGKIYLEPRNSNLKPIYPKELEIRGKFVGLFRKADSERNENSTPSEYAYKISLDYSSNLSSKYKKDYGQYITPLSVAEFMGQLLRSRNRKTVSILDPGAGTGMLSCTAIEHLANSENPPHSIELIAYEIDENILPYLQKTLNYTQQWLLRKKINFSYDIRTEDFVLDNADTFNQVTGLFPSPNSNRRYDYIISNPPYFKLAKSDPRAQATKRIVHGQPNIYAIFMSIAAFLLNDTGELVFITPRSYTAGPYFKVFREEFFSTVRPSYVHLFGSRKDTFDKDSILQENIILKAVKGDSIKNQKSLVTISFSKGIQDLDKVLKREIPLADVIDMKSKNKVLRIPVTEEEDEIVELVHSWKENLNSLGLNISTGPVVAYRASKYITDKSDGTKGLAFAPLLWMQNVKEMSAKWPINSRKPQYIEVSKNTNNLLVPNKNYVLLRRFSSKEEKKRLVAAPYLSNLTASEEIGIENHLNYIYRPKGELLLEEVIGLSSILNSGILDTYFRTSNGNTQVSATELRDMPLPSAKTIEELGKVIINNKIENNQIDELVRKNLVSSI